MGLERAKNNADAATAMRAAAAISEEEMVDFRLLFAAPLAAVVASPFRAATATAAEPYQLDIASLAYSSFALGIENGHLDDMPVVADGFQDGPIVPLQLRCGRSALVESAKKSARGWSS